jgi:hypothetical protein
MKKLPLAAAIVVSFCAFAFGQRAASPVSFVPARSVAVLSVDWQRVRDDEQLKRIVKGDDMAGLLDRIGVGENKVTEFVIFADLGPTVSNKLGVIVNGIFSSKTLTGNLESRGWRTEKIGDKTAYIDPDDGSYLLLLRSGSFVAGTRAAVEQTSGAFTRPREALIRGPAFRSIMSTLGTAAPIRFFIGVPEEYKAVADFAFKIATKLMSFAGMGILGMIFDKIGLIQSMGFSLNTGRDVFPVRLIAAMPGKTGAAVASGGLNLLKKGAAMLGEKSPESAAMNSMVVGNTGNLLSIKFDLPRSAMPEK